MLEELPPDEPLSLDEPNPVFQTPAPDAPGSPTSDAPPECPHASPARVLCTIAIGFIIVFLFLRTFAVEPFGVPTGSMAPTLLGNHREARCPRCGYPIRVGSPQAGDWTEMVCPNCGQRVSLSASREVGGDRLLVDKNIYQLRHPRRWEVAVFRCPDPKDPLKPYVKRVIGLPNEVITIVDGDAYANGELLRKELAEVREARVPVFDMTYVPVPGGWGRRWLVHPPEDDPRLPRESNRTPATTDSSVLQDEALVLDASSSPQQEFHLEYRHWDLDENREEPISTWNSYDGPPRAFGMLPPAHDFSLECTVEVVSASGTGSFACGLFDGADAVSGEIPVAAKGTGQVAITNRATGGLTTGRGVTLRPGRKYRIEFAFVDRRVSLAVDGSLALAHADLPPAAKRGSVTRPVQLGVRGCRVVVRGLKIYRDVHYTQYGEHGTKSPARLGPSEYFMLGDNSGNSEDSRKWPTPGVPEHDFIGKPILIHQPLRIGRVTFGGRERVFQTLDWSRLRWLH